MNLSSSGSPFAKAIMCPALVRARFVAGMGLAESDRNWNTSIKMVRAAGLEPATPSV